MDTIARRLKWARERWQKRHGDTRSASELARDLKWTVSTYLGHENGDRNPGRDRAKRYARAYGVRWEWLLEGDGSPDPRRPGKAPVVGYVGMAAKIYPVDDFPPGEGLDDVDLPPGAPVGTVAVIAKGDSMYPRYFDGEKLFYSERGSPEALVGQECVVWLKDGSVMVKILRKGSRARRFNLESWNAPLLEDQEIEYAAPVRWRG